MLHFLIEQRFIWRHAYGHVKFRTPLSWGEILWCSVMWLWQIRVCRRRKGVAQRWSRQAHVCLVVGHNQFFFSSSSYVTNYYSFLVLFGASSVVDTTSLRMNLQTFPYISHSFSAYFFHYLLLFASVYIHTYHPLSSFSSLRAYLRTGRYRRACAEHLFHSSLR